MTIDAGILGVGTWHTNPFKLTRKRALNEKMPGDDVMYQASNVYLFFQVNFSKDA